MFSLGKTLLANDGLDLCVRTAHRADFADVGQVAGTQCKAQIK
jgi:hypothetical protein